MWCSNEFLINIIDGFWEGGLARHYPALMTCFKLQYVYAYIILGVPGTIGLYR